MAGRDAVAEPHAAVGCKAVATSGRFDSLPCLAYANALFIVGTLGTLITPAMLEAWAPHHWGTTRLGVVAGVELAGLAAGSLSGLWWQRRWNWRRVAVVSLIAAIAGNAACVFVDGYFTVCAARLAVGLAGGLLTALYSAVLANAAAPGRVIAITTFVQIGIESAFLYFSAALFAHLGAASLFAGMAAAFVLLIPSLRHLPPRWPDAEVPVSGPASNESHSPRAYALLAAFIPFIVVQTGVYTFLGEFAHLAAHLDEAQALHAIGISVLASSLGSVAAFALSGRLGLRVPIGAALLLMTATLCGMVLGSGSGAAFLAYISLLQIAWVFLNCYLYTAVIEVNNLLVPAATPVSTLGAVLGASLMGYVLEHGGLTGSLSVCLSAMLLTALLTLPFLRD